MSWALLVWTGLAVLLILAVASGTGDEEAVADCLRENEFMTRESCEALSDVSTGVGVVVLTVVWFVGFVVLALIALLTRRGSGRVCPACGHEAKKGVTVCKNCGYNFAAPGLSREAIQ